MTINRDDIPILEGDFNGHGGRRTEWVLSENGGDKNLRWVRWGGERV
jgi:hypothetical protein